MAEIGRVKTECSFGLARGSPFGAACIRWVQNWTEGPWHDTERQGASNEQCCVR